VELVKESPGTPDAPADSEAPPTPPGLSAPLRPWPGLDHLGAIQAAAQRMKLIESEIE
jgi:hypothetical protein